MRRTRDELAAIAARIHEEGPLPVSKAAKDVPADNRRGHASASTLVKWIVAGKRGVRLEGTRISGKTWWTSRAALARFWGALAAVEEGRRVDGGETPREREARAEAADRELAELVGE